MKNIIQNIITAIAGISVILGAISIQIQNKKIIQLQLENQNLIKHLLTDQPQPKTQSTDLSVKIGKEYFDVVPRPHYGFLYQGKYYDTRTGKSLTPGDNTQLIHTSTGRKLITIN